MAAFVRTKYQATNGDIHPIRIQPDTLLAAGSPPVGAFTSSVSADVRKGVREYGLGPRGVSASITVGTAPNTFKRRIFIPVLTPGANGFGGYSVGGEITYKGQTYVIDSLVPERVK